MLKILNKIKMPKSIVKEVVLDEALKVHKKIIEFKDKYTRAYFEERMKDKNKLIIVAYVHKKPAGYMIGYDQFGDKSFYCWMTGVNPKFRGLGILKSMMEYQEKWAKKKGYSKIKIKTRNNRREMLMYLMKYGFNITEVESQPNSEENRILLEKNI